MARLRPAVLLLLASAAFLSQARPQNRSQEQFRQAGVCARCHVVSVLEWGISGHGKKGSPACQTCHGLSRGHVADERNGVKPDRLPRGAQIATLCGECHGPKCPKTAASGDCQQCHHVHALINPSTDQPTEPPAQPRPAASQGQRPAPPAEFAIAELGLQMALLPAGDFDMGSERWPASTPVHTVHIDAFYLAKTEVTQKQWEAIMGTNPSAHRGADLPVEQVSWNDCQEFLKKLNARFPAAKLRLPNEGEWEYAARAGSGDLRSIAWFRDNTALRSAPFQQTEDYAPHAVATRQPTRWGIYDLFGNVWEWCSSLARPYPFHPDGRDSVTTPGKRILRGGSFADSADYLDPALRHSERPDRRLQWNGLRLARSLPL
ncbi:MAG TPA: SUMF1/EgtB/PvdO family nonheme iron enzyme [Bryobacteraceae bacterium]|nr:SUMF1/EgtB/PvdO family nonheme iron enzyme [Bryobacteraceae bacterium]